MQRIKEEKLLKLNKNKEIEEMKNLIKAKLTKRYKEILEETQNYEDFKTKKNAWFSRKKNNNNKRVELFNNIYDEIITYKNIFLSSDNSNNDINKSNKIINSERLGFYLNNYDNDYRKLINKKDFKFTYDKYIKNNKNYNNNNTSNLEILKGFKNINIIEELNNNNNNKNPIFIMDIVNENNSNNNNNKLNEEFNPIFKYIKNNYVINIINKVIYNSNKENNNKNKIKNQNQKEINKEIHKEINKEINKEIEIEIDEIIE